MDPKNILASKTFWINIAGLASVIGGVLPERYAVPVLCVANIINRVFFTSGPVNILPPTLK